MNNGKICVSVCAKTADELIEQIKRAEELADVIEIRFDCLDESEFDLALQKVDELNCSKPFLATFRPKSKDAEIVFGLRAYLSDEEKQRIAKAIKYRFVGWEKISSLENVEFFDFETDIQIDSSFTDLAISWNDSDAYLFSPQADINIKSKKIIFSEHFFENTPTNLDEIFEGMKSEESEYFQSDIIKIAVQTKDITDSIPIWQLIKKAKSENKEIIPIAMGESGKWTRILGMAHGAFMTYASLDSDKETAPGQVTAKDLIEVYRAKELDETTDVYGILGNNVGISLSPYMHNTAFKFHKLNSVFVP
ncbi:MAG: type I 3-dehydroquinate dehydratase, partial [Acidobacteriota bacterium]